ncbi:Protein of unknown function [Gryllus bimaculatus]|nr:Protein of unknown function [Gryllus bimaculatus]
MKAGARIARGTRGAPGGRARSDARRLFNLGLPRGSGSLGGVASVQRCSIPRAADQPGVGPGLPVVRPLGQRAPALPEWARRLHGMSPHYTWNGLNLCSENNDWSLRKLESRTMANEVLKVRQD